MIKKKLYKCLHNCLFVFEIEKFSTVLRNDTNKIII